MRCANCISAKAGNETDVSTSNGPTSKCVPPVNTSGPVIQQLQNSLTTLFVPTRISPSCPQTPAAAESGGTSDQEQPTRTLIIRRAKRFSMAASSAAAHNRPLFQNRKRRRWSKSPRASDVPARRRSCPSYSPKYFRAIWIPSSYIFWKLSRNSSPRLVLREKNSMT